MNEQYPEIKDRIQSTFIDTILIIVVLFILSSIMDRYESMPDWLRITMFAVPFFFYEPIFQTFGCTLGNLVMGIRVRRNSNPEKRINFFQAMIRYPVKVVLGGISLLTIGSDPKKRALHDLASGSVMIKL